MSISQERVAELITKYVNGELTKDEHTALYEWVNELPVTRKLLLQNLTDKKWVAQELSRIEQTDEEAGWQMLTKKYPLPQKEVPLRSIAWKWMAAAAVVLVIATGAFYLYNNKSAAPALAKDNALPAGFKNDIMPANDDKVTITLADGTVVPLDDAKDGVVSQQAGTTVNKKADQVVYENGKSVIGDHLISYNTISVPRGKKQRLTLPDGSEVWLNAASSLKFPVAFSGKDRAVELTGEAYFEVAKNKNKPFRIQANGSSIEVLGTHFNIKAYQDEDGVKTTLLEGSVKVQSALPLRPAQDDKLGSIVLKPGQQARVINGAIKVLDNEDLDEVMAWKNGQFSFNDAGIETIMRDVERWYDAEVVYEGNVTYHFRADGISRTLPVSKLLEVFEMTNRVHFKIEGKKITVMP
jgi:transmembrane sensor